MINKNEKRRRTFKPVPISDKLKDINKKLLYKFGQLDYVIYAKWGDIVGEFFVQHSEPIKINSVLSTTNDLGERIYDKFLHVNVSPPIALEFQHFQNKIIEKINSYFGYKAIKGIKIHQTYVKKELLKRSTKQVNLIKEKQDKLKIRETTPNLNNKELEESIVKLGLSITKDET